MKKIFLLFLGVVFTLSGLPPAQAGSDRDDPIRFYFSSCTMEGVKEKISELQADYDWQENTNALEEMVSLSSTFTSNCPNVYLYTCNHVYERSYQLCAKVVTLNQIYSATPSTKINRSRTSIRGSYYTSYSDENAVLAGFRTNSPLIYFTQSPESVHLTSELNEYIAEPEFDLDYGWQDPTDPLYYELALNQITLNRHGRNFSSYAEVMSFLEDGDFFVNLNFTEEEKNNSLEVVREKLTSSAQNYYLTILSSESVAQISELNIIPEPEELVRNYFAIYPSDVPVATTGDLVYPQAPAKSGYAVWEYGEMIVQPEMQIFWE